MSSNYQEIYEIINDIPEGFVATYGQIARLLKRPHGARQVGYALAALRDDNDVPWHRVVNARGEISQRRKAGYEDFQRVLLEYEGIDFNQDGRIDLARFLWAR
jgi:methylated-DNA-protein-cysteine methyltransferase-like protein